MKQLITILLFMILPLKIYGIEHFHILNDRCINELYQKASTEIKNDGIKILKDSYGIILQFGIEMPEGKYGNFSSETKNKLLSAGKFLAKIKNPAIIEVHTVNSENNPFKGYRNWEISTIIANKAESFMLKNTEGIDFSRVKSVGYGEFSPLKNTPNNGGKYSYYVSIIVQCNISGE